MTATVKNLRDYQEWSHWSVWNYIHDPANFTGGVATKGRGPKYPLVVLATGLGKSLNIANFIWHIVSAYKTPRVLQLCHVKELVQSNYEELMCQWPSAPAGIYAAGLGERDTRSQIVFAMINSVAKRAAAFGKVDFVLIDECHRLSDNDASLYGKFLKELRKINPNLIVIGYTATDYRMKGGKLTDMGLFDDVVIDVGGGESFLWAVDQGYLIMPVPTDPGFKVDDSGVGLSGGDFKSSEASMAMHDQGIIEEAVDFSLKIAKEEGHKCAVAFAQTIEDAELIADMCSYKGFPMEPVHSKMSGDRDEILKAHKDGKLWGVSNKDILTTGWNNPRLTLMMNLRLTRSPGLWVQMIGRMTRPNWTNHFYGQVNEPIVDWEGRHNIGTREGRWASIRESGKTISRVLDFCGNTERLGPINYPNIPAKRGKGGGEPPVRTCSIDTNLDEHGKPAGIGCDPGTYHHTSVKVCPHCGYKWPEAPKTGLKASHAELVSKNNPLGLPEPPPKKFETFGVHDITCVLNKGRGDKRDTLKATYRSGHDTFNKWVCVEHPSGSVAKRMADRWWKDHGGKEPAPNTVADALDRIQEIGKPKFIQVWTNTDFPEITKYDFAGHKFLPPDLNGPKQFYEPDPDPLADEIAAAAKAQEYGGASYYDDDIPF